MIRDRLEEVLQEFTDASYLGAWGIGAKSDRMAAWEAWTLGQQAKRRASVSDACQRSKKLGVQRDPWTKEKDRLYRSRPDVKARKAEYRRGYDPEYRQRPHVKAKARAVRQEQWKSPEYREAHKLRLRERYKTPAAKAKAAKWQAEYRERKKAELGLPAYYEKERATKRASHQRCRAKLTAA